MCVTPPPLQRSFFLILASVPNVSRIVYSTCSIHATENERVVGAALVSEEAVGGSFKLALREDVLPKWHRRGMADEMAAAGNIFYTRKCATAELLNTQMTLIPSFVAPQERMQQMGSLCRALCEVEPRPINGKRTWTRRARP